MRRWLYGVSTLAAAVLWAHAAPNAQPSAAPPPEEVDVALVLAVDVSYSMDLDELALQRNGYIEAFRSKPLQDAIVNGAIGKIAVTYFEWAGGHFQYVVRPWKIIDSPAAATAFAEELGEAPTRRGRRTSISGAIDLGVQLLEQANVTTLRRVIDISGDGANNDGRPVTAARDEAGAKGIAINGLPVMLKQAGFSKMYVQPFWGHGYFERLPGLREVDKAFNALAAKTRWHFVTTYAYVLVRKERG